MDSLAHCPSKKGKSGPSLKHHANQDSPKLGCQHSTLKILPEHQEIPDIVNLSSSPRIDAESNSENLREQPLSSVDQQSKSSNCMPENQNSGGQVKGKLGAAGLVSKRSWRTRLTKSARPALKIVPQHSNCLSGEDMRKNGGAGRGSFPRVKQEGGMEGGSKLMQKNLAKKCNFSGVTTQGGAAQNVEIGKEEDCGKCEGLQEEWFPNASKLVWSIPKQNQDSDGNA